MTKYDYIPTEFGRTWVASRTEARRGVYTPLSYIDINEGNRFDADVFAQIMYWHEPNTETGESRLTRQKDGNYWLTKNHADWFKETRIKLQTVRKCLDRLKERKLIVYELGGEKGNVTPWIRVNWTEFERRIKLWIENNIASVSEKEYQTILDTLYHTPVTTEQGVCSDITDTVLSDNTPLLPEVKSNTETTSKIDETTNKEKASAGAGLVSFYNNLPTKTDLVVKATEYVKEVEATKPPTDEHVAKALIRAYLDAIQSVKTDKLNKPAMQADALRLHDRGITPRHIFVYLKRMKTDEGWWKGKNVSWDTLCDQIVSHFETRPLATVVYEPETPIEPVVTYSGTGEASDFTIEEFDALLEAAAERMKP